MKIIVEKFLSRGTKPKNATTNSFDSSINSGKAKQHFPNSNNHKFYLYFVPFTGELWFWIFPHVGIWWSVQKRGWHFGLAHFAKTKRISTISEVREKSRRLYIFCSKFSLIIITFSILSLKCLLSHQLCERFQFILLGTVYSALI